MSRKYETRCFAHSDNRHPAIQADCTCLGGRCTCRQNRQTELAESDAETARAHYGLDTEDDDPAVENKKVRVRADAEGVRDQVFCTLG